MVSHSPADWCRLVLMADAGLRKDPPKPLEAEPGNYLVTSTVFYWSSPNSNSKPKFKGQGHRLRLLMELSATLQGPTSLINLFYV